MAFGKRAVGFTERAVASYPLSAMLRSLPSPSEVLQAYWGGRLKLFTLSRDGAWKKNILATWEASLSVVEAVAFVNGLWLAYSRPPCKGHHRLSHKGHLPPPSTGTVLMLRICTVREWSRPSNKWPVHQRVHVFGYCTNCHVCALFINGHRLASNGHVNKCDVIAPRFLRKNGELSLVNSTGKAGTLRTCTLPLISG